MLPPSLDRPYDIAITRLQAANGDVQALPEPLQTLLLVESAHTLIEAGGLAFFYEADFPNHPPYEAFAAAYRRIGAHAAALCIEETAALFPFADPEYFEPLRQVWLEKLQAEGHGRFQRLSDDIAGDDAVWEKLAVYVAAHGRVFAHDH
ncbi:DUF4375 domain-containing protein [Ramlibacter sp.]|uniref:DMP19 family protein n=1 Tax=Ramlibacter sp. TaxID=1917967 RepID=UPI0035AFE226